MKITPGCVILVTLLILPYFASWVMAEKEAGEITDNDTSSSSSSTTEIPHQILLENELDGKLDNNIDENQSNTDDTTTTEENVETTTVSQSSTENSFLVVEADPLFQKENVEDAGEGMTDSESSTSTTAESFDTIPDTTVEIEEIILESSTSTASSESTSQQSIIETSSESTSQQPIVEASPDSSSAITSEESKSPASLVLPENPAKPVDSVRSVSDQKDPSLDISNTTVSSTPESTENVSSEIPASSTVSTPPLISVSSTLLETEKGNASVLGQTGSKKNHTVGIMDILKPSLNTQDDLIIIKPNATTTVEPAMIPVRRPNHHKHKFRNSLAMCHNCARDSLPQLQSAPVPFLLPPLPTDSQDDSEEEEEIRFVPVEADVNLNRKELLKRRLRFQRIKDFMKSISEDKSPRELLTDKRAIIPSFKMPRNPGSAQSSLFPLKNPSDASASPRWNPFTWFSNMKSRVQTRSESFIQSATSFVVDKLTQKFARLTGADISK